jgi:hypothetical protein
MINKRQAIYFVMAVTTAAITEAVWHRNLASAGKL